LKGINIMTTTTNYPTHAGLERLLNTAKAIKGAAATVTVQRLRQAVFIAALMAIVTFAERNLSLGESGFVFEWVALSLVVLLAFFCTWRIAIPLANLMARLVKRVNTHFRDQANDRALYAAALQDSRIMGDLMAARGRSEGF
jgi:ABC-type nickel/cobalt efflux system permease component RcnA